MRTATEPRLTQPQVDFFRKEGYLAYKQPVFSPERFKGLKDHFEEKLACLPPNIRPESMDVPHFVDLKLFDWLLSDEVLDLVEPILGPDIALWSSHFICKPKGDGRRVPWHEDSAYWKGRLDPMEVVTVWLAIDPSTLKNGCMKVIPYSHGNGYSDYEPVDASTHVFSSEVKRHQFDESKAVALELEPNEASLHDGKMIHSSEANTSTIRRCGYTMRYIPTTTRLNLDKNSMHKIYLARGRDRAGNPYGDPTKCYEENRRYKELHGNNGH